MHWVKITHSCEGAIPSHSWATRWVILLLSNPLSVTFMQLSPKPFTLLPNDDMLHKMGRERKESVTSPSRTFTTNTPKAAKPATAYKTNHQPPVNPHAQTRASDVIKHCAICACHHLFI